MSDNSDDYNVELDRAALDSIRDLFNQPASDRVCVTGMRYQCGTRKRLTDQGEMCCPPVAYTIRAYTIRSMTATAVQPRRRRRSTAMTAPSDTAVAYLRVSTAEQVESGAGLDAQRAAITAEAARRGWTIVGWRCDEGVSGSKGVHHRPGLASACELIEAGHASVLMVAKTDRVARSLRTLLAVIDCVERVGGNVVAVDGSIDTASAPGRFQTQIMGSVAELERALISDRTREALAAKRAAGVRLGRPSVLPLEVVRRILDARAAGVSYPKIAAGLEADRVPTAHGGARWHPGTVRAVELGQDGAACRR